MVPKFYGIGMILPWLEFFLGLSAKTRECGIRVWGFNFFWWGKGAGGLVTRIFPGAVRLGRSFWLRILWPEKLYVRDVWIVLHKQYLP